MAALLPVIAWNPFGPPPPDQKPYDPRQPIEPLLPLPPKSAGSWTTFLSRRYMSASSQPPTSSARDIRNNENTVPVLSRPALLNTPPKLGPSRLAISSEHLVSSKHGQNKKVAHQRRAEKSSKNASLHITARQRALLQSSRRPRCDLQKDFSIKAEQEGLSIVPYGRPTNAACRYIAGRTSRQTLEPFPDLEGQNKIGTVSVTRQRIQTEASSASNSQLKDQANTTRPHNEHHQRHSDASSGFVHTIKTASMSNASLSIIARSLRIGRSSESHGYIKESSRHSLDSDRHNVTNLLDEAAFRRGLKRKQIINELIMTEESYIADLKALLYLYTTLLVSATTISDYLRLSIQRNVIELLRVHEDLLEKLHQATFKAAARKWADTATPSQLRPTHHPHWKRVGFNDANVFHTKPHCRVRSSIDVAEVAKVQLAIGAAEPADILDIADIFSETKTQLFAYEEYCANHATIAHELHKHLPSLWSAYESGMESLNKTLLALDKRQFQDRKGLTVGDLLIKPVQRICKYPLLLQDLLSSTPVADGPAVHKALEATLGQVREVVRTVNLATDNHTTRLQIQRKWLLQDRLILDDSVLSVNRFRTLGTIQLCGVLYVTYQSVSDVVVGNYAACILFDDHFLVTRSKSHLAKLEPIAIISLADLEIESAANGKGLQSQSSLHTWKIAFKTDDCLYELLLSACSKEEEERWMCGLKGQFRPTPFLPLSTLVDQSRASKDFTPTTNVSRSFTTSESEPPFQPKARGTNGLGSCQVTIRNTHNPQDLHEFRNFIPQLDLLEGITTTLSPKRAERTRLETSISEIYTKDRLPFPGMVGSKGSQIIRASAGSLVRKLSFASMQASFSKRSASLSSKKSSLTIHVVPRDPPTFLVKKHSIDSRAPSRHGRPKELPELDTMSSVIERMIGDGATTRKRLSFSNGEKLVRRNTKHSRARRTSLCQVGPDDPAKVFYDDDSHIEAIEKVVQEVEATKKQGVIEDGLTGSKKRRWSNPMARLRGMGSEGIKNILYSTN